MAVFRLPKSCTAWLLSLAKTFLSIRHEYDYEYDFLMLRMGCNNIRLHPGTIQLFLKQKTNLYNLFRFKKNLI